MTHGRLNALTRQWLVWLADPSPTRGPPGSALGDRELCTLLEAAELHGVLALCLDGLRRPGILPADATGGQERLSKVISDKSARNVDLISVQLLLAHYGDIVRKSLVSRHVPFTVVKGQTFAKLLYPNPILRRYTDIDVLIPAAVRKEVSDALRGLGFTLRQMEYRGGLDYFEDKWTRQAGQELLIEVHCDLVHNPNLRRSFSLSYDDVLQAGGGDPCDATALLLVAGAHGAIGHQFDRLLQVIDVLQCSRGVAGSIDVDRLRSVSDRCGLTLPIAAALCLAGQTFGEERCKSLLNQLAPRTFDTAAKHLLSSSVTLGAQSSRQSVASLRRKLFRQALRYSAISRPAMSR